MTTAYTTARNQLNVQLELDGSVWTGLFDSRDIDRYAGSNETWLVEEFGQAKVDELFPDGVRADCFGDRDCRGKFAHSTRTCKSGQRRNVQGRTSADAYRYENSCTRDLYDSQWHHYLVTTRPDGAKGYNVYLDGTLRASSRASKASARSARRTTRSIRPSAASGSTRTGGCASAAARRRAAGRAS